MSSGHNERRRRRAVATGRLAGGSRAGSFGQRGRLALRRWLARLPWRRRVRTPTMLQMQEAECGAACLGIILGHFGRHEPLEKLRHLCGVSRDGARASNILRAGHRFGLRAKGLAINAFKIRRAPMPVVALWNFTHFVVVEGFGRDSVWLNDPASGPRTVTTAQFNEAYSGVVLAFAPGPDLVTNAAPPGALGSVLERIRSSRRAIFFVALASIAFFFPGLLIPAFSRVFVDFVLIEDQHRWLWPLIGLMTLTALFAGLLGWLLDHGLIRFYTKLQTLWSSSMMWRVLRLPVDYFAHRSGGDISNRIQSNGWLAWLVSGELSRTLLGLTTLVVYALIMVQYDPFLTAIGVAFAAVNLFAFANASRQLEDRNQELHRDKGKSAGLLMQGLRSIDTYQASGTETFFYNRWAGHHAKVTNADQALGRTRAVLTAIPPFLGLLSTTAVLLVGGLRIMDGTLTIGMLVAFQGLMAAFTLPVKQVVDSSAALQETLGLMGRLDDVMRQEVDPEFDPRRIVPPDPEAPRRLGGEVCLQGVCFGFSPLDRPLIEDFDLHLAPGSWVALVGASGSGKSTIGKLISGLLAPWQGSITIDGRPIQTLPREVLRDTLAVVDQSIALFEGTVAENITLWDSTLPESRVIQAAKDACLHEEIASRCRGYRERIDEGGRNFSGGERQRIEIARALVGEPSVLLLDEATSALDARTEDLIIRNLRRRGCTTLLIAHRLSTIRDCDEIIVLDQGRVVERGTHDELIALRGTYHALVES